MSDPCPDNGDHLTDALFEKILDTWNKKEKIRAELIHQTELVQEKVMKNSLLLKDLLDNYRKRIF